MRFLGIPCRVVTNYQSAHDVNANLLIDMYHSDYGVREIPSHDSIWWVVAAISYSEDAHAARHGPACAAKQVRHNENMFHSHFWRWESCDVIHLAKQQQCASSQCLWQLNFGKVAVILPVPSTLRHIATKTNSVWTWTWTCRLNDHIFFSMLNKHLIS